MRQENNYNLNLFEDDVSVNEVATNIHIQTSLYIYIYIRVLLLIMNKTTDVNKEFHPYGIIITQHERGEGFKFMFQTIKDLIQSIHGVDYKPTVLVADSSVAITNGFAAVFELIKLN